MPSAPEALADTTAWIALRRGRPDVREAVRRLLERRGLAVCAPVLLELLRGARNRREVVALRSRVAALPQCHVVDTTWVRAQDVLEQLASLPGGRHRGVPLMDLLIAAVAEEHGLPLLHDDSHFDLIGQVTGQPLLRLAG
jgi:predicted nucleic acid-binding protein